MSRNLSQPRFRLLLLGALLAALAALAWLQTGTAAAGPPESPQNEVPWTKVGPNEGGCYWADIPWTGAIITWSGCPIAGTSSCTTTWSVVSGSGTSRGRQTCTSDTDAPPGDRKGRTCKAAAGYFPEVCPEPRGGQNPAGGTTGTGGSGGGRKGKGGKGQGGNGGGQTGGNLGAYGGASYAPPAPAAPWGGRYGVRTYRPRPVYTPWWARR